MSQRLNRDHGEQNVTKAAGNSLVVVKESSLAVDKMFVECFPVTGPLSICLLYMINCVLNYDILCNTVYKQWQ